MLQKEELDIITSAIRHAENHTSGEIRVCVAKHCKGDPLEAASRKFQKLKMHETRHQNGVLIYVAPSYHKAAIYGDRKIVDETIDNNFWDEALDEMLSCFRRDEIMEGICRAVAKVGELLKARYPAPEDNENELGDEVIIKE